MVRVIGWTPTSRGEDPSTTSLKQFSTPFEPSPENEQDYPLVRSGHRCFTDNDYFYVIGGYTTQFHNGAIFREVWAMSLTTFEWRRYEVDGVLPKTLASFAIVQLEPFSTSFLLFGGSGTEFGSSSSNKLFLVHVNNEECMVTSRRLNPTGMAPRPMYGHAMCAGEVPGKYYIMGGTEGSIFNFNVYSLTIRKMEDYGDFVWNYELVTENSGFSGRYRLEATYDEKSDSLIFFGGGNTEEVFGFDKIVTLNVRTGVTTEIMTVEDPKNGYPTGRRCHTIVRHKRHVIMSGGIGSANLPTEAPLHSDVWLFNLDDFTWKKSPNSLPEAVFFHDSAITEDGWMLSFGGVHGLDTDAPRNNVLFGAWFDVPTLQRFAIERLRNARPEMFTGLYCGNFRQSQVLEIVTSFLKPGKIEEKEKEIIETQSIKFRETSDRKRYYLNEDGKNFISRTGGRFDDIIRQRQLRGGEMQDDEFEMILMAQEEELRELNVNRGMRRAFAHVFEQMNARVGLLQPAVEVAADRESGDETDSGESLDEEVEDAVEEIVSDLENEEDEDEEEEVEEEEVDEVEEIEEERMEE